MVAEWGSSTSEGRLSPSRSVQQIEAIASTGRRAYRRTLVLEPILVLACCVAGVARPRR